MYSIIRPLLFKLDPELSHHLAMKTFKLLHVFGLLYFVKEPKTSPRVVMGLKFKNLVGLADRFNDIKEDKYGSHNREPLGNGFSRQYDWPDRCENGAMKFGVPS